MPLSATPVVVYLRGDVFRITGRSREAGSFYGEDSMTKFERVRQLLNAAVGAREPGHGGKGRFWDLPLDQLKAVKVLGQKVIETEGADRGARSALVKAVKGEPPFDGDGYGRMPLDGPYLETDDVAFIQQWIDDGCPEDEFTPPAGQTPAN